MKKVWEEMLVKVSAISNAIAAQDSTQLKVALDEMAILFVALRNMEANNEGWVYAGMYFPKRENPYPADTAEHENWESGYSRSAKDIIKAEWDDFQQSELT